MLKAYIEQIIPCAYTILGIESFIIFSMCFRHPKALVSTMPALIAFWNIGMCTGYRADNGKLYLANANKLYIALFCLVYIGVHLGTLAYLAVKENKRQCAEASRRAEQEAIERKKYNEQIKACREFEEFNRVYDYTIPRMELTYNCGSNQRFKISDEALQKKFAEQIDSIIERQEDARESLSDCCTFVTEVVVPNIDNINLRQNVQRKVRDVVSRITASNIRCRVYYKTPVRGEVRNRYVELHLVKSRTVAESKTFAQEQRALVTPKIRFEVLKRDNFTCQYCGAHGEGVVLEVDHIIPISKGGTSDMGNLITACFDCNRGKGSDLVTDKQAM